MLWFIVLFITVSICISFFFYLRCSSRTDFLIGSRKRLSNVAGVSAQTVLLGFFFTITVPLESAGQSVAGAVFAAAGMIAGIYLSRLLVTRRIRVYSELSGNAASIPEFLENRFSSRSGILRAVSSAVILIIEIMFAAEIMDTAASILDRFTSMGHVSAVITCALLTSIFVFLGGFTSIAVSGYIRSALLLVFFVFILISSLAAPPYGPVFASDQSFFSIAAESLTRNDLVKDLPVNTATFISYALLFFGIPFINTMYMSTKERRSPKRRILYELIWTVPCAAGAIMLGVIAGTYSPVPVTDAAELSAALSDGTSHFTVSLIMSLLFISCLKTADSAIFSAGTAFSYDLFSHGEKKITDEKKSLLITRIGTLLACVAATLYALIIPHGEFFSISFIIAIIASTFGPIILFGLYCKALTAAGAVSAIAGGLISASVFNYLVLTADVPQITAVIPSFAIASLLLFGVSLIDRKSISKRMLNEFGRTREISLMK